MNSKGIFILLPILILMILSGCVRSTHVRGTVVVPAETHSHTTTVVTHYAPPPHAPAHGYRHHYHNHDLQYYSDLGAYMVIGTPGVYFYGGNYLRFINGAWQFSVELGKPWRPARDSYVPRNLRDRHLRKHRDERREHRRDEQDHRHDSRHQPPRHGHRRHQHGYTLSYDAGIGAYRVIKQPGIYFYDDRYIRYYRGSWQETTRLNRKWRTAKERHVPAKLWREKNRHSKPRDRRDPDYRDNDRRSDRHRQENRRDSRRDDYRRDKYQRNDKPRDDYRRDKYQRDDKRRDDYRRDDDKRRDGKHKDRDDDERRDDRRHDDRRYDDGKKLQDINDKFFQGLQQ